jgi:hypothetical protein
LTFCFRSIVLAVAKKVSFFAILVASHSPESHLRFVPDVVDLNPAAYFAPVVLAGRRK